MNQVNRAVCKIAGKVRAIVDTAVSLESPCNEHLRKSVGERELNVGVRFVVAQQNVEARLFLFDEIVLKRQRLAFVFHDDVLDVDSFAHE